MAMTLKPATKKVFQLYLWLPAKKSQPLKG